MTGYYFQTEWRNGSATNKGLSVEQFFYNQIYESIEKNTAAQTLPFFDRNLNRLPRELSTGKVINDENIIALEQSASQQGYKSNIWIYGAELEKLKQQGYDLNLKRGAEPVLCMTRLQNQTHINDTELYISDGGTGGKSQFLYNFDSLDERSQKALNKYFDKAQKIDDMYTKENFINFRENITKNKDTPNPEFIAARQRIDANKFVNDIDVSPVISAHYKHMLSNSTGSTGEIKEGEKLACYRTCQQLVNSVQEDGQKPYMVGMKLAKALETGSWFARSCTAKNCNLENAKKIEEMHVAEANRSKVYRRSSDVER